MKPPESQPLITKNGLVDPVWLKWFQSVAPQTGGTVAQTVSTPSWTYSNGNTAAVSVAISGGTVTLIEASGDGTTFADTGVTAGLFTLQGGDTIRVTSSVAPSVSVVLHV